MNAVGIKQVLAGLGARSRVDGENVVCACPLAPFYHQKGTDKTPSFGVKINEKGLSVYNCFACSHRGTLLDLIITYTIQTGERPVDAISAYLTHEIEEESVQASKTTVPKFKVRLANLQPKTLMSETTVPSSVLSFLPYVNKDDEDILTFFLDRKISLHTIAAYRLRKCRTPDNKIGIVFPILAQETKQVLDLYVRLLGSKEFFRLSPTLLRQWYGNSVIGNEIDFNASHLLFGNHLIDRTKAVVLVEAPVDAMRLYSAGFKNVGASNGGMSKAQLACFFARAVYLGFDDDDAGHTFAERAFNVLKKSISVIYQLDWGKGAPKGSDKKVKDPCDIIQLRELMHVFAEKRQLQGVWVHVD